MTREIKKIKNGGEKLTFTKRLLGSIKRRTWKLTDYPLNVITLGVSNGFYSPSEKVLTSNGRWDKFSS